MHHFTAAASSVRHHGPASRVGVGFAVVLVADLVQNRTSSRCKEAAGRLALLLALGAAATEDRHLRVVNRCTVKYIEFQNVLTISNPDNFTRAILFLL